MTVIATPITRVQRDWDTELLLIAEASHWLADASSTRPPEAVRSIMEMLDRQQRVAACRALTGAAGV